MSYRRKKIVRDQPVSSIKLIFKQFLSGIMKIDVETQTVLNQKECVDI